MTHKKKPAATEVTTSALNSAIVAERQDTRKTTIRAGNKPPRRNERRKARDRKRCPDRSARHSRQDPPQKIAGLNTVDSVDLSMELNGRKPCYIRIKPKGPVLENTFGRAVAAPTDKRGFVVSELARSASARASMVAGRMGLPARMAARLFPCFQHPAHPLRLKTWRVDSESRRGVPTMTKVYTLARAAAPITVPGAAAPFAHTTDADVIALHAAAENALAAALKLLRDPQGTADDLQRAAGRVYRAATLMGRLCAAHKEGVAA